jgi:hypothetical protein
MWVGEGAARGSPRTIGNGGAVARNNGSDALHHSLQRFVIGCKQLHQSTQVHMPPLSAVSMGQCAPCAARAHRHTVRKKVKQPAIGPTLHPIPALRAHTHTPRRPHGGTPPCSEQHLTHTQHINSYVPMPRPPFRCAGPCPQPLCRWNRRRTSSPHSPAPGVGNRTPRSSAGKQHSVTTYMDAGPGLHEGGGGQHTIRLLETPRT